VIRAAREALAVLRGAFAMLAHEADVAARAAAEGGKRPWQGSPRFTHAGLRSQMRADDLTRGLRPPAPDA
jgi:hypothetical protein